MNPVKNHEFFKKENKMSPSYSVNIISMDGVEYPCLMREDGKIASVAETEILITYITPFYKKMKENDMKILQK